MRTLEKRCFNINRQKILINTALKDNGNVSIENYYLESRVEKISIFNYLLSYWFVFLFYINSDD